MSLLNHSWISPNRSGRKTAIREANRKLNLLNSITRHDIRNQLMVAQGFTQLALHSASPMRSVTDFLAKITAAIETIQRQIEFTKAYQELGVHAPAWFPVDEIISSVRPEKVALHNTCKAVEIFADPMIDKVFFNLFDNAVKHGEAGDDRYGRVQERGTTGLSLPLPTTGAGSRRERRRRSSRKGTGRTRASGSSLPGRSSRSPVSPSTRPASRGGCGFRDYHPERGVPETRSK